MAMDALILVANPGSASRKYALYAGEKERAALHFEYESGHVICSVEADGEVHRADIALASVTEAAGEAERLLREQGWLATDEQIERIGLRVVAPSGFFLYDHVMNEDVVMRLKALRPRAPLHIDATLHEYKKLRKYFPAVPVVGISDSAFHITKPDYAWNYGLPLVDSDRLELKRFGYHGLSAASVVRTLHVHGKLPPKMIVCHLGSGASVTAVWHGKSRDTTMGYSPLEGLIMATRAGSIDASLVPVLKAELALNDAQLDSYLNEQSGLLGLSGSSSDIRELLDREANGDHYAHLALETYVYNIQKAIGQMTAALGGADVLLFTGTVGERSAAIRERVMQPFHYLDFILDHLANGQCVAPSVPTGISRLAHSRPVFVVPANEAAEIARRTKQLE